MGTYSSTLCPEALMALAALKHSRLWQDYWAAQARKAG
jgi:hypothetical protein